MDLEGIELYENSSGNENQTSRDTIGRLSALMVIDYSKSLRFFNFSLLAVHRLFLWVRLILKNACIITTNACPTLWDLFFLKKMLDVQWTVYRSDSFIVRWTMLSLFMDFMAPVLFLFPFAFTLALVFINFSNSKAFQWSTVSTFFSLAFYAITIFGIAIKISTGENLAVHKDIKDKFNIDIKMSYWFWGAESASTFQEFVDIAVFKSTDGYYISGSTCFIFDRTVLRNPSLGNELSLICAKYRRIGIVYYNTVTRELSTVPVCFFFSKAPNSVAKTKSRYDKLTRQLSNSNLFWLVSYLGLIALGTVFSYLIGELMVKNTKCYNCRVEHLYNSNSYYLDDSNCEKCNDAFSFSYDMGMRGTNAIFSFIIIMLAYLVVYSIYCIDQLFVTSVMRIECANYQDNNKRVMDKLKSCSCFKVLNTAFREQMGDFEFDATYFNCLNSTRYYLTDTFGIPVSVYRRYLNVFAVKMNCRIHLRKKLTDKSSVLDSEFNPDCSSQSKVVLYYNRKGQLWLLSKDDEEDVVELSATILHEVILKV